MNTPISEIVDRYTILLLKNERLDENLEKEINLYKNEIDFSIMKSFVDKIYDINGKIWDLESDIRKGREGELGLEEVGRRAIEIRKLNKQRVSIKNEIVRITGDGFIDVKMNHGSD